MPSEVIDNTAKNRFELEEDGETAFLLYKRQGSFINLVHTEVPQSLQGKGVGSKLASGALQLIRAQKLTAVPLCPFVVDYLKRHHEYLDVVAAEDRRRILSSE